MNTLAAFGFLALAATAMPRGVPREAVHPGPVQGGRGLGDDVLGHGDGDQLFPAFHGRRGGAEGSDEHRLVGRETLEKRIQSLSDAKTFSFNPTSQEMVVAWEAGLGMTILSYHLGSVRSS